jgi:hypothetical protein
VPYVWSHLLPCLEKARMSGRCAGLPSQLKFEAPPVCNFPSLLNHFTAECLSPDIQ